MASKDKLGMSLDDIIQLDKKKRGSGNLASRSSRGRGGPNIRGRGGPNIRDRGGPNIRGRGGPNIRGRGGSNIRGRGGSNIRGPGGSNIRGPGGSNIRGRGGSNIRGRGGSSIHGREGPNARGRGRTGSRDGGGINIRGRGVSGSRLGGRNIRGRGRSMSRDSGGIIGRGRIGVNVHARGGRNLGITNRRGQRGLRGQFRGNQGMTNSFRSDHIIRQQVVQQKIDRVRSLKQLMPSKNNVSGASDMLTVCITNDLAVKRRRRSRSVPRTGSVNNFGRNSFVRRGNNNMYLNRQSLDRLNASTDSSSLVGSPEGSVVTTLSRRSRASSVGRNRSQRSSSVGRDGFLRQNQGQTIIEQYLPVSPWQVRSGLNMQLQKEIAAIQGKTYLPPTSPAGFANGSTRGLSLSEFRPVPTLTTTTLNERFS